MVEMKYLEVHNLEYHNVEEFLEDKDSEIFNTILLNDNVETTKNKLKLSNIEELILMEYSVHISFIFLLNKPLIT